MDGSWQVACLQRNFHVTNPLSHFRYIRTTTFLGKINNRVRLSGLGSSHHNSLLINWLQSFFNDESLIAKTLIILYHIWKARNHLIFRNIDPNPIRIAFSAANMFLNYSADIPKKNTNQIHSSLIKWKCPPPGMIKLNFDGSVKLNSSASAGFILRNSSGTPILASAKSLGKSSIIVAEAMALRAGLQACLFHNHTQIEAEGDSKILIDCINKKMAFLGRSNQLLKTSGPWFRIFLRSLFIMSGGRLILLQTLLRILFSMMVKPSVGLLAILFLLGMQLSLT